MERYLAHHGIEGQKWGVRRYQNPDGSLTDAGRIRYYGNALKKARKDWYQKQPKYSKENDAAFEQHFKDTYIGDYLKDKALYDKDQDLKEKIQLGATITLGIIGVGVVGYGIYKNVNTDIIRPNKDWTIDENDELYRVNAEANDIRTKTNKSAHFTLDTRDTQHYVGDPAPHTYGDYLNVSKANKDLKLAGRRTQKELAKDFNAYTKYKENYNENDVLNRSNASGKMPIEIKKELYSKYRNSSKPERPGKLKSRLYMDDKNAYEKDRNRYSAFAKAKGYDGLIDLNNLTEHKPAVMLFDKEKDTSFDRAYSIYDKKGNVKKNVRKLDLTRVK